MPCCTQETYFWTDTRDSEKASVNQAVKTECEQMKGSMEWKGCQIIQHKVHLENCIWPLQIGHISSHPEGLPGLVMSFHSVSWNWVSGMMDFVEMNSRPSVWLPWPTTSSYSPGSYSPCPPSQSLLHKVSEEEAVFHSLLQHRDWQAKEAPRRSQQQQRLQFCLIWQDLWSPCWGCPGCWRGSSTDPDGGSPPGRRARWHSCNSSHTSASRSPDSSSLDASSLYF